MQRRNSVNINELINRFQPIDDDLTMSSENVKYVKATRPKGKMYAATHDEGDEAAYDENSLMKYNERRFDHRNKKRSNMTNAVELTKQTIAMILSRISGFLEMISKFPFPRMSVMSFGLTSLFAVFICPRSFTERALYPGFRIIFSIIYPAYRSFKAVRNKNLKEYLKWIVYWIVYAFFTCFELLTDALLSWFPFYFEIKIIFFIWMLGPSSRGAMKIYKTCIHPTLVSREQEIDDIIQIAQDRGYMHVFRLGSKSVNYANKIIMQDAKSSDNSYMMSHQLMKNISLSNISDAGMIASNDDTEDTLRLRKFSTETIPYANQFNFPFEQFEARRKPSVDYRCDDISSGYSSPEFFRHVPMRSQAYIEEHEDDREMYYRNLSKSQPSSNQSEVEKASRRFEDANHDLPRRKASINMLSEDEIVFAYNRLQAERNQSAVDARSKNEDLSVEMKEEFLRWIEMKRSDEKSNSAMTSSNENTKKTVKVNTIDETEIPDDVVNVVKKDEEDNIVVLAEATEHDERDEFDEFKDVISDNEEGDEDYLKVPLVILENDETKLCQDVEKGREDSMIAMVIESNIPVKTASVDDATEQHTIEAKMTLSNAPLEVVTSLSSSNFSLESDKSDKSGDDASTKKRPVNHSKGRAPPPPPQTAANVMPGYYYDHVTKKHFKETEL